jgi:hypothetical protein
MAGFYPLPAYKAPEPLDFSPVERAVDNWHQAKYRNALLDLRGRSEARADEEQGWQRQKFQQESDDRRSKALGAAAQSLLNMPPEQRGKALQAWRMADKDFDSDLQTAGFHPDDVDSWAPVLLAKARGVQDPLDQEKARADIDYTRARANYYNNGGRSAAGGSSAEERQIDALMSANPDLTYPEAMEAVRTRPSDRTRRQSNAIGAAKAGLTPEEVEPWETRFGVAPRSPQPGRGAAQPQPANRFDYSGQMRSQQNGGQQRLLQEAQEAIRRGARPEAVRKRLRDQYGITNPGF